MRDNKSLNDIVDVAAKAKTAEIAEHYGEVARRAAQVASRAGAASKTKVASGAGMASRAGAASGSEAVSGSAATCECCESDPARAGEAFSLYASEVLAGLPEGALAASRGCGDPVAKANLQPGERVLDLGSGGGIDALIAARLVGSEGYVFGLDMTPDMVALARRNAEEAGIGNVEFIEGSIDDIPLPDNAVDVVLSNCVINLCENKQAVFAEAKRVLAPSGRLVVSDIVAFSNIPEGAEEALAHITGCRRGITPCGRYREMMAACGFSRCDIEPKTVYTEKVLREKAERKERTEALETALRFEVDSVCGSAIIRGHVPDQE